MTGEFSCSMVLILVVLELAYFLLIACRGKFDSVYPVHKLNYSSFPKPLMVKPNPSWHTHAVHGWLTPLWQELQLKSDSSSTAKPTSKHHIFPTHTPHLHHTYFPPAPWDAYLLLGGNLIHKNYILCYVLHNWEEVILSVRCAVL